MKNTRDKNLNQSSDFTVEKILSGGQTGVDRAALDICLRLNIAHGGWCPKGRKAEDGVIANKYQHILDLSNIDQEKALLAWLHSNKITVLNITGPRESQVKGIYDNAFAFLERFIVNHFKVTAE